MTITFDLEGQLFGVPRDDVRVIAENLFDLADWVEGEGYPGAAALADILFDAVEGRFTGTIPLEGEAARAMYYALNKWLGDPNDPKVAELAALWRALSDFRERERGGS